MISYTKIYLCCTIKRLSRRSEHDLVRKQKTELFRTALEHELQKAHKKVFVSDLSSPIISSSPNPNGALRESRKRISLCVGFKTCNCSWWHLNSTLCERTTQHHTSTVIENERYFLIYMIHLIQMFTWHANHLLQYASLLTESRKCPGFHTGMTMASLLEASF